MTKTMDAVTVGDVSIPRELMTVDNDLYSIYQKQEGDLVMSITVLKPNQRTRGHSHKHWEDYTFDCNGATIYLNGAGKDISGPVTLEVPPRVHHVVYNNTDQPLAFLCRWFHSDTKRK